MENCGANCLYRIFKYVLGGLMFCVQDMALCEAAENLVEQIVDEPGASHSNVGPTGNDSCT